jgi:ESX secretion system protein EccE
MTTVTTAPQRARRGAPRPQRGARGRIRWWPVLCVQGAAALLLGGYAADSVPLLAAAVVPAAGLVLVALVRRGGEPLPVWAGSALALRRRRRRALGPMPPGTDPLFSLAAECQPGLRTHAFAGRERRDVGMAADGGTLTAVLRVEVAPVARSPLRPSPQERPLPLSLLYDALDTDGIRLESVKAVQYTQPAPTPLLPPRAVAAVSYAALTAQGGPPALRLTWVALRLDPELCAPAVAERGGGLAGAQRCLVRAADQLASRLTGAGFTAAALSEAELLSAVAAGTSSNPATTTLVGQGDGPRPRRTVEGPRVWRCDDRWHTTYQVARWPTLRAGGAGGQDAAGTAPFAGLVALLTSCPAFATSFALTLRGQGRRSVALSGHIRVTGRGDQELRAAGRGLVRAARGAGVRLARMERRQLTGVVATLPLGGGR